MKNVSVIMHADVLFNRECGAGNGKYFLGFGIWVFGKRGMVNGKWFVLVK